MCVCVFALSTVAISISVANLQAYFRTVFPHRLQSSLFLLITVELGWRAREDKAVLFPLQPQCQSRLIENVSTVLSTNEFRKTARLDVTCKLTSRLHTFPHPSFDTPHIFAFVLSETWHFYWQDLKGNDKVNQKFAYVIPIMLDSPAM